MARRGRYGPRATRTSRTAASTSPTNARKWFYDKFIAGDPVIVKQHAPARNLQPWDGYGDWQIPAAKYYRPVRYWTGDGPAGPPCGQSA